MIFYRYFHRSTTIPDLLKIKGGLLKELKEGSHDLPLNEQGELVLLELNAGGGLFITILHIGSLDEICFCIHPCSACTKVYPPSHCCDLSSILSSPLMHATTSYITIWQKHSFMFKLISLYAMRLFNHSLYRYKCVVLS